MFDAIQSLDLYLLNAMRSVKDPVLVWLAFAVSTCAWKGWLWWTSILLGWFKGNRHFAVHLAISLLICTVAGLSLKGVIQRPRPDLYTSITMHIPMPELLTTQHSFPSGHTLMAAAFAFSVVYFYKDLRAWLAIAFVILVGAARVYEAMHWPSDIVGSIVMGIVAGLISTRICQLKLVRRVIDFGRQPLPVATPATKKETAAV